jgi:hypothetical protein
MKLTKTAYQKEFLNQLEGLNDKYLVLTAAGRYGFALFPEAGRADCIASDGYFVLDGRDRAFEEYWGQFGMRVSVHLPVSQTLFDLDAEALSELLTNEAWLAETAAKARVSFKEHQDRAINEAISDALEIIGSRAG